MHITMNILLGLRIKEQIVDDCKRDKYEEHNSHGHDTFLL